MGLAGLSACDDRPRTPEAGSRTQAAVQPAPAATDARQTLKEAGAAVAQKMGDAAITASVAAGLAKDVDLSATQIDVDTSEGVVTLTGPAPSAEAKARAESIAKTVEGVKSVNNRLVVKTL